MVLALCSSCSLAFSTILSLLSFTHLIHSVHSPYCESMIIIKCLQMVYNNYIASIVCGVLLIITFSFIILLWWRWEKFQHHHKEAFSPWKTHARIKNRLQLYILDHCLILYIMYIILYLCLNEMHIVYCINKKSDV